MYIFVDSHHVRIYDLIYCAPKISASEKHFDKKVPYWY